MKARVNIINETSARAPSLNWEALCELTKKELGKNIGSLTLVFILEEKSRELNRLYRKKDGAANVLSFVEDREVLISPKVVYKEAKLSKIPEEVWMQRLFVHGILHLEGYRHDIQTERERMEALEDKILGKFQSSRSS